MLMLRQRQFIAGHFSVCTALDHVKANLGRIGGLELHLDAVQLPLEPLLGAGVDHLAPHARRIRGPSQTHIAIAIAAMDGRQAQHKPAASIRTLNRQTQRQGGREGHDIPCDEEDLALLAVLLGDEVVVEDGVPALIGGEAGGKVIVVEHRLAHLLHHHHLLLLVDLVDDEAVRPLGLELQEPALAVVIDSHP